MSKTTLALAVVAIMILIVVVTDLLPSRTDGMTCDQLRTDNLSMTSPQGTRSWDPERAQENNQAAQELGCAHVGAVIP